MQNFRNILISCRITYLVLTAAFLAVLAPRAWSAEMEPTAKKAYDYLVARGEIDSGIPENGPQGLRVRYDDLNLDMVNELLVTHKNYCGSGGCNTWVLTEGSNDMRLLLKVFGFLSVQESKSDGYKDLKLVERGGALDYITTHYLMKKGRYKAGDQVSFSFEDPNYFFDKIPGGTRLDAYDAIYSGAVARKYPIVMGLLFNADDVSGEYVYTNHNEAIKLLGKRNGDKVELREFVAGAFNGTFTGVMNHGVYSGKWSNASGSRSLPFKVVLH